MFVSKQTHPDPNLKKKIPASGFKRSLTRKTPIKLHVKGKIVPVLPLNSALRHEGVLGEWTYRSTHSLTSALVGGEWSASHPGCFTPRERAPRTHGIGGWVGLRAVLDAVVKRKIPNPRRESRPRTPIVQPVAQRYTN
jgi:hypothetical protein